MRRTRLRLLTLFVSLWVALPVYAWDAAEVIQGLALDKNESAAFTEIKYLESLERPIQLQGEVRFTPPDGMEKLVTAPYEERMTVADGWLTLQRGDKVRELALEKHAIAQAFVTAFIATLAGDHERLQTHYEMTLSGEPRGWQLLLVPRDRKLAGKVSEIVVKGNMDMLQSFETRQPGGDRSVMIFSFLPSTPQEPVLETSP